MPDVRTRGVAIVVFADDAPTRRVLVLHRRGFDEPHQHWAWSTPGGAIEPGEEPNAAAKRELFEETGLSLDCRPVFSSIAETLGRFELHVFLAKTSINSRICLSNEHDRHEWVTVTDLQRCQPAWVREMYVEVLEAES